MTDQFTCDERGVCQLPLPTGYRGRAATLGVPFGSIERPQLPGRPEDEAMWEVAGGLWAAVHDHGTGLAVLTEAKYGVDARGAGGPPGPV